MTTQPTSAEAGSVRATRRPLMERLLALSLLVFSFSLAPVSAQETNSDTPPPAPRRLCPVPPGSTRPSCRIARRATTFIQAHPELSQPPAPANENLTLRPPPSATNERLDAAASPSPSAFRFLHPEGAPGNLAAHLLVVYNETDPDSKGLAAYYASRRNIPAERVLGIACPVNEEITRPQYEETIREPIISYLSQKGWLTRRSEQVHFGNRMLELLLADHNDIWAIVLMRGVPLKISSDPADEDSMEPQPELQTNAAAVDSELATLPLFGLPRGGFVPNPFYDRDATGLVRAGPELATKLILVTRLDGPRPDDVRRMIDDSIYAETHRLAGLAVIDSRGITDVKDGYAAGDVWLRTSRDLLALDGWSVRFDDKPDLIPNTDPLNEVALYLGWYSGDANGPWITPPNRFVRGAIAYHLHSYSAATVRSASSAWVGPLIVHGAAATMGTVYEPYLDLTPHLDIFTKRLLDGDYFAEAAYASGKALSWMTTVVGDPLYRPFRQPLASALAAEDGHPSDHRDWLLLQQIQRDLASGLLQPTVPALEQTLNLPSDRGFAQEGLGDLLDQLKDPAANPAAEEAYTHALTLDTLPIDRIRVGLKLAQHYIDRNQAELAQNELKGLLELYPHDATRFGIAGPLMPTGTMPSSPHAPGPPSPPKP